jgi:predicted metalloprotease
MKAGGGLLGIIVLLASMFLPKLLNGTSQAAGLPAGSGSGISVPGGSSSPGGGVTCTSDLEQIVCGIKNYLNGYWTEALPKFYNGTAYRKPAAVVWFDADMQTGCGTGSPEMGPFYCPVDEKVYLDLAFMQKLEKMLVGTTSDLAEQYIVAHEWGHHIQNILGINAQVQQAQQNNPGKANQYSVAMELQADCFAGVVVGDMNKNGLLDSANEVQEALAAAKGVGDDAIQMKTQGHINQDAWTHGSSEQRMTWFNTGYSTMDPTQCDTFKEVL